jgi:hypothetical protein
MIYLLPNGKMSAVVRGKAATWSFGNIPEKIDGNKIKIRLIPYRKQM